MDKLDVLREQWTNEEIRKLKSELSNIKYENLGLQKDIETLSITKDKLGQKAMILAAKNIVVLDKLEYPIHRHVHVEKINTKMLFNSPLPTLEKLQEGEVELYPVIQESSDGIPIKKTLLGHIGKCEECGKVFVYRNKGVSKH